MNKRILRFFSYIFAAAIFLFGLCIYAYPLLSGYVSEKNSEIVIENFENIRKIYQKHIQENDSAPKDETESREEGNDPIEAQYTQQEIAKLNQLYEEMQKYNQEIYHNGQAGLCDAWSYQQSGVDLSEYGIYEGVVGILRVPRMSNLKMPILLGASKNNMSRGATQLGQTSMPIGGNNTNCVIAGHRGWCGAKYFVDIEQMQIGDMVYIDNLWETLAYKVCDRKVIKPEDIDEVLIQENRDMVTLITCHPYRAHTHRYAVFCSRVEDSAEENLNMEVLREQETQNQPPQSQKTQQYELSYKQQRETIVIENYKSSQSMIFMDRFSYIVVPCVLVILAVVLAAFKRRK